MNYSIRINEKKLKKMGISSISIVIFDDKNVVIMSPTLARRDQILSGGGVWKHFKIRTFFNWNKMGATRCSLLTDRFLVIGNLNAHFLLKITEIPTKP